MGTPNVFQEMANMMSTLDRGLAEQKSNMSEVEHRMISLKSDTHSNEKQTEQNHENIVGLMSDLTKTNKRLDALEKKMKEDAAATSEPSPGLYHTSW
jgi:septal ring factor EnvC (AmiA/AmiB activator)